MAGLPRITIVTPSFNQEVFLELTLRSVLSQNYPNLEYIVMDGGSTDGSVGVIRRYASRLTHWESGKDKGQADAISRGFANGSGEVFGYLNSDDLLLPGCLNTVGRFFAARPDVDLLVGNTLVIDAESRVITYNWAAQVGFKGLLYYPGGFSQPSSFWRRQAYERAGGLDVGMRFCLDLDLYLRLLRCGKAARVSKFLGAFRLHETSKTATLQEVADAEREIVYQRYQTGKISPVTRRLLYHFYRWRYLLWRRINQAKTLLRPVTRPNFGDLVKDDGSGVAYRYKWLSVRR